MVVLSISFMQQTYRGTLWLQILAPQSTALLGRSLLVKSSARLTYEAVIPFWHTQRSVYTVSISCCIFSYQNNINIILCSSQQEIKAVVRSHSKAQPKIELYIHSILIIQSYKTLSLSFYLSQQLCPIAIFDTAQTQNRPV